MHHAWIAENSCPPPQLPMPTLPAKRFPKHFSSENPSLSCTFIQELAYLSLLYSHMVSTRWEAAVTSPAAAGPIPGPCLSWPLCPTPTSKRPRHFPGQELLAFLDYLSLQNFFRVLNGSFIVVTACLFFRNVFKCLKLAYEMQSI